MVIETIPSQKRIFKASLTYTQTDPLCGVNSEPVL